MSISCFCQFHVETSMAAEGNGFRPSLGIFVQEKTRYTTKMVVEIENPLASHLSNIKLGTQRTQRMSNLLSVGNGPSQRHLFRPSGTFLTLGGRICKSHIGLGKTSARNFETPMQKLRERSRYWLAQKPLGAYFQCAGFNMFALSVFSFIIQLYLLPGNM